MRYCKDCNKEISKGSKLGRCKSCASKERTKHLIVHYYCIDCEKEISSKHTKRCHSCASKGENNNNFKGGKPNCVDCGKLLKSYVGKKCPSCASKNRCHTEETKQKMRKNHADVSGNKHPFFGKKRPEHSKIMTGKKLRLHTEKEKKKQSLIMKEKYKKGYSTWNKGLTAKKDNRILSGRNNPNFGKIMKPHWAKYKGINMRSSYEIAYAKYLDKKGIKWAYESKTFDLGNTTYTPDFKLSDTYIEIKGYMSEKAYLKIKKFLRQYPNINLQILMQKDLQKMGVLK